MAYIILIKFNLIIYIFIFLIFINNLKKLYLYFKFYLIHPFITIKHIEFIFKFPLVIIIDF